MTIIFTDIKCAKIKHNYLKKPHSVFIESRLKWNFDKKADKQASVEQMFIFNCAQRCVFVYISRLLMTANSI